MRDLYSDKPVLSHLLDSQIPSGQWSEQLGFRFGQVESSSLSLRLARSISRQGLLTVPTPLP